MGAGVSKGVELTGHVRHGDLGFLLWAWAWLLFLIDDQLPDMQTSDFEFLDIEALDPSPLHSQRPDR
jgi:hypothetical protein